MGYWGTRRTWWWTQWPPDAATFCEDI
jgi:hypothetical protein